MLKGAVSLLFILLAGQASAQSCPDFFRFVDFGLRDRDGVVYRGGPVFRAESFSGAPLLLRERTRCLSVRDLAKDGRGNPIPVVTSIEYSPENADLDLTDLRVAFIEDTQAAAETNARDHRAAVSRPATNITRGPDFLCATSGEPLRLSCQFKSPFPEDAALIVYCDETRCRMPVLAINEEIHASAGWASGTIRLTDPSAAGADISARIQSIHDFLTPISSGL